MKTKLAPWKGTTQQILIGVALATLIVAVIEANTDYDQECGWGFTGNSIRHYGSGDTQKIRIGRGRCRIEVSLRGNVDFTPDNRSVAHIDPDAYLQITQQVRRERQRLRVKPGRGGMPEYTWHVNRLPQEWDEGGQAWLAEVLPQIYRSTGLDADVKVAQLWAVGGIEAVLNEMEEITSDRVRAVYLRELLPQCTNDEERVRAFEFGGREISSDYEMARALAGFDTEHLASAEVRAAWLGALKSIDSDWELRRALTATLGDGKVSSEEQVSSEVLDALLQASHTLGSDHELAGFLILVAEKLAHGATLPPSYFKALELIGSDHDHKRTLKAALARPGLSEPEAFELLSTAHLISSDFDLAELLAETARTYPHDRPLPPPFFAAMESLDSASALRGALSAVVKNRRSGPELAAHLLKAARSISSDFELSAFLIQFLDTYPKQMPLPEEFQGLIDRIDSKSEREKITKALAARKARASGTINSLDEHGRA